MKSVELREKFLKFFEERGHKVIPSASLVPENDPSVLFTTAGMHPLVPYLLGEKHPLGDKLCNVQKCLRTDDIDEVGDAQHLTFFEMLGYWSLGDYFKKESIHYTFDFYTQVLGFNKDDISITVFAGDNDAPFDQESFDVWKNEIGIPDDRIYKYGKKENWWGPVGSAGPCGPDTEMFIDTGIEKCGPDCGPSCHCDKFVEIGNNVFMEYNKTADGKYEPLEQKNVDVGLGLERLAMFSQGKKDVFEIDTFEPVIKKIEELSGKSYQGNEKAFRIIADHIRAAVFAIGDGTTSSNKGPGYVVRRLIRRAIRYSWLIGYEGSLEPIVELFITESSYEMKNKSNIKDLFKAEEAQFSKIIENGLKQVEKIFNTKIPISQEEYSKVMQFPKRNEILHEIHAQESNDKIHPKFQNAGIIMTNRQMHEAYISGKEAFDLYQTHGLPLEILTSLAQKRYLFVGTRIFREELKKHQELSRTASAGMFKGGLADNKVETTRLHTAAHLLLAALRQVLSPKVSQKGSNITEERLRFDFNWSEKLTPEQLSEVENLVNEKIKENIPVTMEKMALEEALKNGATGSFGDRYGEVVKVYTIGENPSTPDGRSGSREFFSREICGGPHVEHTGELGIFRIKKEESSSAGVRRIKAVLE